MGLRRVRWLVLAVIICSAGVVFATESTSVTTAERLVGAVGEPNNWLHHHGTYSAHHFSTLAEINRDNVSDLKVAWTFSLGGTEGGGIHPSAGLEATPLVEDGFMYAIDGWGVVTKLDVRTGRGKFVWRMDPGTDKDWAGEVACCGVNNRGVALWGELVLSHTLDGRLVATAKDSGEIAWERQIGAPESGETITVAPLIVKDMVITGVSGGEFGIRGWLEATDLNSGKRRWRRHTIAAPDEPGGDTWADDHEAYKTGGGGTWVTGSYDSELNLIYWGVGNPGPDWDRHYRPGDNLFSNSTIALDADTGEIKFHFQYTPNDPFDFDGVNEHVLVDTQYKDKPHQMMLHADRNGYLYAINRVDGSFIYATPYVQRINWTSGIDPVSGRPLDYDPEAKVQNYAGVASSRKKLKSDLICPGIMGGKNWMPMAYNPQREIVYIPVNESCNTTTTNPVDDDSKSIPREWFTAGGMHNPERFSGSLAAIDVKQGKMVMRIETEYPILSGVLATAGDLVFTATPDGDVVAYDAENLKELWRFATGSGLNAPPITYAVNGKQYIAISVGLGGTMPKWWIEAVPGLENINPSAMIFSFSL